MALFFLLNAISATSKVSLVIEIIFILFYGFILWLIKRNDSLYRPLLDIKIILPLCLCITIVYFLIAFPLNDFNSIVFKSDFVQFQTIAAKGIETIKHGGLFGWDSSLVGGYYTLADMNNNMSFLMLPFAIFGNKIAFHLMLLFFVAAFPLLIYYLIKLKTEDNMIYVYSLIFSIPFLLYYFRSSLRTGTIDWFLGAFFFTLSLISLELYYKKTRFSPLLLTISLGVLFYMHLGIFIFSLFFIFLEFLSRPNKNKHALKLLIILFFVFLATIHFTYYFLSHPDYLILNNAQFNPLKQPLNVFGFSSDNFFADFSSFITLSFAPHDINRLTFLFLPIIFALKRYYNKDLNPIKYYGFMAVAFLLPYFGSTSLYLLIARIIYILPIFIIISLSYWINTVAEKHKLLAITILLCLPIVVSPSPSPFPHIKNLASYNKELVANVQTMDGNLILLETRTTWQIVSNKGKRNEVDPLKNNLESLFPLETGKKFFANYSIGYHHSRFRANAITAGTYRGDFVDNYPISTFNDLMTKWGIHYLILWSNTSIDYFGKYPQYYRKVWNDKDWYIFEFRRADTRSVATSSGSGSLIDKDYFGKIVILKNIKKNEEVVVRSNYLENWRAFYKGAPVLLYDKGGQMAFKSPAKDDVTIELKFPKYIGLSIIAIGSILAMFLLCYNKIL